MSEYEQRQYKLMSDVLEAFEEKSIGIRTLIDSLKGLMNALGDTDNAWKTEFGKSWWVLERIYSISSYRKDPKVSDESLDEISQAVEKMRKALSEKLDD